MQDEKGLGRSISLLARLWTLRQLHGMNSPGSKLIKSGSSPANRNVFQLARGNSSRSPLRWFGSTVQSYAERLEFLAFGLLRSGFALHRDIAQ